jgi:gliding motility-associated lipoprotein GldD
LKQKFETIAGLASKKSKKMKKYVWLFFILTLMACKKEVLPKPAGQLRLDFLVAKYESFNRSCPFDFDLNTQTSVVEKGKCNFEIHYPKMKATIYLSYKPVKGNIDLLLRDAQKLTYEHVVKADDIVGQPFLNTENRVFGMFYDVNGNAATNAQFYVTDSTKHFMDCSVYFYAKPNFDSILPAVSYLKKDMRHLMESFKWK